jgi:hypothetical protein
MIRKAWEMPTMRTPWYSATDNRQRCDLYHRSTPLMQAHDPLAPLVQLLQLLKSIVFFVHGAQTLLTTGSPHFMRPPQKPWRGCAERPHYSEGSQDAPGTS